MLSIILHVYHKWKSYDVWFLRYGVQQTGFFLILDHFLPFYPLTTQKIKILKNWKKAWRYHHFTQVYNKLQKRICKTVGPSLAASIEPLAHCQNVASLSLFYRYYFGRCSSELAQLVPLPFLEGGLLVILIDCMIFLSPFLNVTRMSMSSVSFLTQLDSGILCL